LTLGIGIFAAYSGLRQVKRVSKKMPPVLAEQTRAGKQKPPTTSQQRQGDDGVAARLQVYVRFVDLKAAGIVGSWMQLRRLIEIEGFPRGVMLAANSRAWPLRDVQMWLDSRPTDAKPVNVAKMKATRRRNASQRKQPDAATSVET
jgi:hypothetical protein